MIVRSGVGSPNSLATNPEALTQTKIESAIFERGIVGFGAEPKITHVFLLSRENRFLIDSFNSAVIYF